ncbi:hypothetical protein G6F56_009909 [Rhizopus delemar]|nr:hypothetical protein G6F56_009909 [Rhizopus delemar]
MDVYIGSIKEDCIPDTDEELMIEFTRLGFVRFDNNAGAQFRARELKSIKTNMDGEYVRLVIRNCHSNNLNVFNQKSPSPYLLDNNRLSVSSRAQSVSSNSSVPQPQQYMPNPIEIQLEQWEQILKIAEEEAVQNEVYQAAKVYNYLSEKMGRFLKIVSDLEAGKRYAVESKDYDEAEKIKGI